MNTIVFVILTPIVLQQGGGSLLLSNTTTLSFFFKFQEVAAFCTHGLRGLLEPIATAMG